MLELVLFGERLLVLRGPLSIALLATVMIISASSGAALARALKKRFSRIDRAALICGAVFGLVALQLREATVSAQALMTVLQAIAALSIGAATAAWALAASAAITRKKVLRLSGEGAILELSDAIDRIESLAAENPADPAVTARLESLRRLRTSIEHGVLSAACRAPLERVLKLRSEIPQSLDRAELAQVRVRAYLQQLSEARELITRERDGRAGSIADRIGVAAGTIAADALSAVDAISAAYEKLDQQLSTHLLRAEVDHQANTALRLARPVSESIVSDRSAELKIAEQIIAAADLSETIAVTLNAANTTAPLDRALEEASEATHKTHFREVLASLRE